MKFFFHHLSSFLFTSPNFFIFFHSIYLSYEFIYIYPDDVVSLSFIFFIPLPLIWGDPLSILYSPRILPITLPFPF